METKFYRLLSCKVHLNKKRFTPNRHYKRTHPAAQQLTGFYEVPTFAMFSLGDLCKGEFPKRVLISSEEGDFNSIGDQRQGALRVQIDKSEKGLSDKLKVDSERRPRTLDEMAKEASVLRSLFT
jgi:hypothetical protein